MKKFVTAALLGSALVSMPVGAYMGNPMFGPVPGAFMQQQGMFMPAMPGMFAPMGAPMMMPMMPMMPMNSMPAFGAPARAAEMQGLLMPGMSGMFGMYGMQGMMIPYKPKWWVPPSS
jgi:hypothetical protein